MSAMKSLLLAAFLLAACTPRPAPKPQSFRDPARQVYSIAGLQPGRIQGEWQQMAGFGTACHGGSMAIGPVTQYALCLPQGVKIGQGEMRSSVPGRFDLPGIGDFWVLWADADNRTMVIGTPSGRYGMILNRGSSLPPDRLKAARDILQFNGYDVSQLRVY